MSIFLKIEDVDPKTLLKIKESCTVKPCKTQYNDQPRPIRIFQVVKDRVYLPIGVWREYYDEFPTQEPKKIDVTFKLKLLSEETDPKKRGRDQDVVFREAVRMLKDSRVCFLWAHTGFGKGAMMSALFCKFKFKAVVVCYFSRVIKQLVAELERFTTAKVQFVEGKVELDPKADIYVMGAKKALSFSRQEYRKAGIGMMIVDEAHKATVSIFTELTFLICPQYLLGLSATPDSRTDGLFTIFEPYFGSIPTIPETGNTMVTKWSEGNYIYRFEIKPFKVIKYYTPFEPELSYIKVKGRMVPNWTKAINSLSYNAERHKLIVKLIKKSIENKENRVIVVMQRTEETKAVMALLDDEKIKYDYLYGNKDTYDDKCDVLVGNMQKMGTGFNDETLNVMIMAADLKDVRQLEGRCRTVGNTIYRLVDQSHTLENHWKLQAEWFLKRGATIEEDTSIAQPIPKKKKRGEEDEEMPSFFR